MRHLTIIFFAVLCVACSSEKMGDHTVLLNATQSQWLEASPANRRATAHFWAWEFAGKPKSELRDTIDRAAENLMVCIDGVKVDGIDLAAKATARTCWGVLGAN